MITPRAVLEFIIRVGVYVKHESSFLSLETVYKTIQTSSVNELAEICSGASCAELYHKTM